jgi:midasin (ATPase involved in ribosome maturation)
MEKGWWFLADEFNLADPVVMCMLFPLLEGKGCIQVPGTDKIVRAAPGFRFFATQNDASYAGRHQLPVSLRNRFLEVQVGEFSETELPEIIFKRKVWLVRDVGCAMWEARCETREGPGSQCIKRVLTLGRRRIGRDRLV